MSDQSKPRLSPEKEFNLIEFETRVRQANMTVDQAKDLLIELYRNKVIAEAQYQALLGRYMLGLD